MVVEMTGEEFTRVIRNQELLVWDAVANLGEFQVVGDIDLSGWEGEKLNFPSDFLLDIKGDLILLGARVGEIDLSGIKINGGLILTTASVGWLIGDCHTEITGDVNLTQTEFHGEVTYDKRPLDLVGSNIGRHLDLREARVSGGMACFSELRVGGNITLNRGTDNVLLTALTSIKGVGGCVECNDNFLAAVMLRQHFPEPIARLSLLADALSDFRQSLDSFVIENTGFVATLGCKPY